jgi:hypothetical protein
VIDRGRSISREYLLPGPAPLRVRGARSRVLSVACRRVPERFSAQSVKSRPGRSLDHGQAQPRAEPIVGAPHWCRTPATWAARSPGGTHSA